MGLRYDCFSCWSLHTSLLLLIFLEGGLLLAYILSKKSSAQIVFRVSSVLTRDSCIYCYISLFTEIILQQGDPFKIKIKGTLAKL